MKYPKLDPTPRNQIKNQIIRRRAMQAEIAEVLRPFSQAIAQARIKQPALDKQLTEGERMGRDLIDQPGKNSLQAGTALVESLRSPRERLAKIARVDPQATKQPVAAIAGKYGLRLDDWDAFNGGIFSPIAPIPPGNIGPSRVDIGAPALPWLEKIEPPFPAVNEDLQLGGKEGDANANGFMHLKIRGSETVIADDWTIVEASLADFVMVPQQGYKQIVMRHEFKDGGWARVFGVGFIPAWLEIFGWISVQYFSGPSLVENVLWSKTLSVTAAGYKHIEEPFTDRTMVQVQDFVPDAGPVRVRFYRFLVADKGILGSSRSEVSTQWKKTSVEVRK
jgi:hypothetical protein